MSRSQSLHCAWKFIWTNILKVYKYILYFKSADKTGHLTAVWTENVSKYTIELNLCT